MEILSSGAVLALIQGLPATVNSMILTIQVKHSLQAFSANKTAHRTNVENQTHQTSGEPSCVCSEEFSLVSGVSASLTLLLHRLLYSYILNEKTLQVTVTQLRKGFAYNFGGHFGRTVYDCTATSNVA